MARKAAAVVVVAEQSENLPEAAAAPELPETIVSSLILHGDLSKLTPTDKVQYYHAYCKRIGLDPVTQPFKILKLSGKEVLYCDRSGTQQLNKLHSVSHRISSRNRDENVYIVTAIASLPDGRQTESIGAVSLTYPETISYWDKGQKVQKPHPKAGQVLIGDDFCNALMKAETKAKRRATLDLLGLGILDETETETIPNAVTVPIDGGVKAIENCKAKLDEAKSLPHLANIWKKHYHQWVSELSAEDFADLTEHKEDLKDRLTADFHAQQAAAAPEPEYLITADQIERIRQIVKPGGTGTCLTEFEIDKLLECANNQNSTQAETESLIELSLTAIRERESQAKSELEDD